MSSSFDETQPHAQQVNLYKECVNPLHLLLNRYKNESNVKIMLCYDVDSLASVCCPYKHSQICYVNGHILPKRVSFASRNVLIAEPAILVICWGPHGILDVPCQNMWRTQEYLCLHRALYTVFVVLADGNRHSWSFTGTGRALLATGALSELSLQASVSGNLHWYTNSVASALIRLSQEVFCRFLIKDYCKEQKKDREKESKSLDRMRLHENQSCDILAVTPDPSFNGWCSPHIFAL